MSKLEDTPFDAEVLATLDAIDATLAGDPVDPQHADMAELALLLASERPAAAPTFAAALDDQVQRRFAAAPQAQKRSRARWWVWAPAGALAASLVVAVVIVVGQGNGGPRSNLLFNGSAAPASKAPAAHQPAAASSPALGRSVTRHAPAAQGLSTNGPQAASASSSAAPPAPSPQLPLLQPPNTGRKVIQGAQLSLSTSPHHVDDVAQEVFTVVGQQKGIVNSSRVTANGGPGGYAQFQLSVPSANLAQTMAALSSLQFAHVASRTDTTQDVTNQFRIDQRHLADDKALRTALLKQLAGAITQAQIDSLKARIHDAEAAISSDEAALRSINRSVGYSQIYVGINAGEVPVPVHHSGGGLTLGKAAHTAGHVLTVAAGVALIGLAALLPIGLVAALLWWVGRTLRRRSRLQALDLY
jgi:hypothetical protein